MKRIVAGVACGLALLALGTPAFALKGDRASGRGTADAGGATGSVTFSFNARGTGSSGYGAVGSFKMDNTALFGGAVSGDVSCLQAYTLEDGTESVGLVEGKVTKATDTTLEGKYVHWVGVEINSTKGSGFWTEAPTTTATGCEFITPLSVWSMTGRVNITSS